MKARPCRMPPPETFSDDDSISPCIRKRKRAKAFKNCFLSIPSTATLMEAQEFGEMMEHVDEVTFALYGLRNGQSPTIRRASFLSLLSICSTPHHRRILHCLGVAKTIIDAILDLSLNDSPSNVAAATLFYVLTMDGQDDHLLESPGCIRFLIDLLRQNLYTAKNLSTSNKDTASKVGSKLLALRKNAGTLKITVEKLDSSSVAIFSRVQEILVNCKELKYACPNDSGVERPELCPKWIALLTIEKACSSSNSLGENSGAVRKTGGNFREKLRELGGLNVIYEITVNCLSDLECWMEDSSLSTKDLRNAKRLKSLTLLLKCLKIMENATFRSKDNQIHLLGLKRKLSSRATRFSFVELVIAVIKILSENKTMLSNSTGGYHDTEKSSVSLSVSETLSTSRVYKYSPNMRSSSASGSCDGASRGSDNKTSIVQVETLDSNQDPFAFVEDDIAPSNWNLRSCKQKKSHNKKYEVTNREFEDGYESQTNVSRKEFNNVDVTCSSSYNGNEAGSSLLTDCLLTAVRVLMNLTNDNPVGCQQIVAYGGLETMPLLIADHFLSFGSSLLSFAQIKDNTSKTIQDHQLDRHLGDHELDFLVAILVLLINLVEKDGHNRLRLAAASVLLPTPVGLDQESHWGVIQLLCSIFLANQGGGEEAEDDEYLLLDDKAVLQDEKEAEKTILEGYSALLLAFLSTESKSIREAIVGNLPHHDLSILVPVLDRFMEFHLAMNLISPETHKAVSEVIESCRVS